MEWKKINKIEASEDYQRIVANGSANYECEDSYIELRNELEKAYSELSQLCRIENGEVLDNTINQSGTIRNAFGTEAQTKKNAASYGMSEDGTISGIEAGKYRLQLYYNYRDPQTKKQTTYILTTTGDTDIVVK